MLTTRNETHQLVTHNNEAPLRQHRHQQLVSANISFTVRVERGARRGRRDDYRSDEAEGVDAAVASVCLFRHAALFPRFPPKKEIAEIRYF